MTREIEMWHREVRDMMADCLARLTKDLTLVLYDIWLVAMLALEWIEGPQPGVPC